jgi:zinc protease
VKRIIILLTLGLTALACGPGDSGPGAAGSENAVTMQVPEDPTVAFRILFNVGSQNDPAGKEGIAALTAAVLSEGSTTKHSYEEILALLYPMAASIGEQVDKEMTVFYGRTHLDNLDDYYALFKEVLLEPAFVEADFERVKSDHLNYIKTTLRYSQDEELGKEALYEFVFEGTPYEHNEEGTVKSVESITLDDVKEFYRTQYTGANLVIGLGGGFDNAFAARVQSDFEALPAGAAAAIPAPAPKPIPAMHVRVIQKNAPATAISFGFPIDVKRGEREFYALAFATAWLGEHRNGFSHLYEVIRERRGLNYGDYAYVEHFPGGHRRQFPPSNVARRAQIFQVWIRPVPHEANVFSFRAALREIKKLIDGGMSEEDFNLTKKFLKGYILHYAPTTMAKLGYALDDRFYGIDGGHWETYAKMIDELTREEVNAALSKHLTVDNIKAVFITDDADGLKDALVGNVPSPITYESDKPAEIYEEDEKISTYPLSIAAENVTIVQLDDVFED